MNAYPTYQAAKIANPDQEIYELHGKFQTGDSPARPSEKWKLCKPADYCMTLGELRKDHGGEAAGDMVLGKNSGKIRYIVEDNIGHYNDSCFVLYAKALEETKTYRYEKVADKGFFDLKNEFQGRMIFFNQSVTSTPDYVVAMDIIELSHHYMQKNLYHRIEVTERDLELEAAYDLYCEWWGDDHHKSFNEFKGEQMTATRECWLRVVRKAEYKLVNGKG